MSKTIELRRFLKAKLDEVSGITYYRNAPDNAVFPFKSFELRTVTTQEGGRDDINLTVDLWDKAPDPMRIESLADDIEHLLAFDNAPQSEILPTVWKESRSVENDADYQLQHVVLVFTIQNYER